MNPLRTTIAETIKTNPDASEKEHREACWRIVCASAFLRRQIFDYAFGNAFEGLQLIRNKNSTAVLNRAKRRVRHSKAGRTILKKIERLILMNLKLPDGTLMRDARFGQCAKAGGFFSAVGKCGKPNETVGKKLTENDLQNIWSRIYQSNAA